MWARVESDTVTKIYTRPKALSIGDVNYPANIFSIWTSAELKAIGIYEVVIDNTNLKNQEYYINTNQTFAFASDTVTASYGTATAKAIADTLYTAQNVTDDVYPVGHAKAGQRMGTWAEGDVQTRGLKYNHKEKIDQQAGGLLQDTDWMVIRAAEGGTAVPGATTTWRTAVRTKANSMQAQIDGAANVDALAALYEYNDNTPPVRPLGEFPILGS
tara:strand:- start:71 stop:715 length:645 start_codon:yes stop_codon:yes gene_type:complete